MWDGEMWGCCRMVERWHDEIVEMWNDGIVDCVGRWICGSLLLLLLLYCFFTCAGEFEALAYVAVFFFCYVSLRFLDRRGRPARSVTRPDNTLSYCRYHLKTVLVFMFIAERSSIFRTDWYAKYAHMPFYKIVTNASAVS